MDFADRLDMAVARSREAKQIEGKALPADGAGEGMSVTVAPPVVSSSPTIRDLLPPTRQEKALLRRA